MPINYKLSLISFGKIHILCSLVEIKSQLFPEYVADIAIADSTLLFLYYILVSNH